MSRTAKFGYNRAKIWETLRDDISRVYCFQRHKKRHRRTLFERNCTRQLEQTRRRTLAQAAQLLRHTYSALIFRHLREIAKSDY